MVKETAKNITVAKVNITPLDFRGMINCLVINLNPSLIGCNKPNNPTLYGPLLLCTAAIIKRSNKRN